MKTDQKLKQDVIEELEWEPSVDAMEIGVDVADGVVTLSGHVGSFSEKWSAERAAQRVHGVKGVVVALDVTIPGGHQRDDGDIAHSARNILQWTAGLQDQQIQVAVENAWVTLAGKVDWDYQRQLAAGTVSHLTGVRGVSNNIAIATKPTVGALKESIRAAFDRRARQDANTISIQVEGAEVTLSGQVPTWAERELAVRTAWGTPGVQSVVDRITVGD